jgi:hypothetical protein
MIDWLLQLPQLLHESAPQILLDTVGAAEFALNDL